jgi:hypothetical protein
VDECKPLVSGAGHHAEAPTTVHLGIHNPTKGLYQVTLGAGACQAQALPPDPLDPAYGDAKYYNAYQAKLNMTQDGHVLASDALALGDLGNNMTGREVPKVLFMLPKMPVKLLKNAPKCYFLFAFECQF